MPISLVKYQNRNGGKVLLSKNSQIEMQESGLMIKFPAADKRKPHFAVLVDNDSLSNLVDEILEYLQE